MAGGWPAAVVLGLPVVALVVLLVWVVADAGRSRRLADLIRAARPASAGPQLPAALPKDWELPGLPAETGPGLRPEVLTHTQVEARIRYGLAQEWTQRRIGEFAGRSAATVHKAAKTALGAPS